MEVSNGTLALRSVIPQQPEVGVYQVEKTMGDRGLLLPEADLEHVVPFNATYHAVQGNVIHRLTQQAEPEEPYFRQPTVLDTATGVFDYHYSRQLLKPEKHWAVLINDERSRFVDPATQFALGMMAHIGGDLARTVYETAQTRNEDGEHTYSGEVMREYVKYDYPKIDKLLKDTAHDVAPMLLGKIENERTLKLLVNTAIRGVALGRQYAKRDYSQLVAASSEDERQHVISRSHTRTAKLANTVLGISYEANTWLKNEGKSGIDRQTMVLDLANSPSLTRTSLKIARLATLSAGLRLK